MLCKTHVADVDDVATFTTRSGVVGEGVRRTSRDSLSIEAAATHATKTSSGGAVAAAATITKSASSTESSTAEAAAAAKTTTKATATIAGRTSEAIFLHLKSATLPLVSIELLNSVAGVVGGLENNNTGALHAAVGGLVNIGTEHGACVSYANA